MKSKLQHYRSHYAYLEEHFVPFLAKLGLNNPEIHHNGVIVAHGDKCYSFEREFEENGIPFYKGVAIYLLLSFAPYSSQVRDTDHGWVHPKDWIIDCKDRFLPLLPDADLGG